MTGLILVAGNSRRMGELTAYRHKTMLKVKSQPILHHMLTALVHEGINKVCFVCGYRQEELKQYVADNFSDLEVIWIENPVYAETNTAYSVWLTRDTLENAGDDVLLINGDVVLDHHAIHTTLVADGDTVLAVRRDRVAEEEVKVRLDDQERIIEIGKHLVPAESAGESVGINRLSTSLLPKLYDTFEDRIQNGNGKREFYEASFDALIQKGEVFTIADVTNDPVMEVDTPEDYEEVCKSIAPRLQA